jgi:hypothetical protein
MQVKRLKIFKGRSSVIFVGNEINSRKSGTEYRNIAKILRYSVPDLSPKS